MLLEFKVANFKSIRYPALLSLVAGADKDRLDTNTTPTGLTSLPRAVRVGAMYGGNAAGKSNLLKALEFMRGFVLGSANASQEGQPIVVDAYAFDPASKKEPTHFEVHFVEEGVRYEYGFTLDRERVYEEWLNSSPKGRVSKWFHRAFKSETQEYLYEFGSYLLGQKQVWEKSTRTNALFLSTAIQLNSEQLRPVFAWFQKRLAVVTNPTSLPEELGMALVESNQTKKFMLDLMKCADSSIEDLRVVDEIAVPGRLRLKIMFTNSPLAAPPPAPKEIVVTHRDSNGTGRTELRMDEESQGTQNLFALGFPWFSSLTEGRVLFVDELDASLHPLMTEALIKLFQSPEYSSSKAQVFLTTHDTSLMSADLLRRDQIWFAEKDQENSTRIYPLTDYSPRKTEALERGYLRGRFGALPKIEAWIP